MWLWSPHPSPLRPPVHTPPPALREAHGPPRSAGAAAPQSRPRRLGPRVRQCVERWRLTATATTAVLHGDGDGAQVRSHVLSSLAPRWHGPAQWPSGPSCPCRAGTARPSAQVLPGEMAQPCRGAGRGGQDGRRRPVRWTAVTRGGHEGDPREALGPCGGAGEGAGEPVEVEAGEMAQGRRRRRARWPAEAAGDEARAARLACVSTARRDGAGEASGVSGWAG